MMMLFLNEGIGIVWQTYQSKQGMLYMLSRQQGHSKKISAAKSVIRVVFYAQIN
jgi:hypothetical protein